MARRPRLFGKEIYHHIYAWGNNRQAIFITDQHYEKYLDFLATYSRNYRVDTIAYALMQSHVHLFVYDLLGKVSQFMNILHGEYAQYYNHVTGRIGHVFGERFNNKIVQVNEYGLWLSRYIHRQAVESGLVANPRYYPWTSYREYLEEAPSCFLKPDIILDQFGDKEGRSHRYEAFVLGSDNGSVDWQMKSEVIVGDEDFKQEVSEKRTHERQENLSDERIYELINVRFKMEPRLLFAPHGLEEKRLRHAIIRYLVNDVGIKPSRITRLFRVSCSGVHRVLNTKV